MRKKVLVILGVEVFIIFLAITLLGLFLLYPNVLDNMKSRLKEESRSRARVIVASVANQCIEPMIDGDDLVLGLIIARAAKDYEGIMWGAIANTEGETVAHTDLKLVGKKMTLPLGILAETQGDFVSGFYGSYNNLLWAAYPITVGELRRGTVHIGMSADPGIILGEDPAVTRKAIFIYIGLGALCALLIPLLSYRPIRNLSFMTPEARRPTTAKPMEKGFEQRMAKRRKEEAELSERIVKMRNRERELTERIKSLKKQAEVSERSGDQEPPPRFVPKKEKKEPAPRLVPEKEKKKPPPRLVPEKEKKEPQPQLVSEKERIKAIRKRIHELEEKMRGKQV